MDMLVDRVDVWTASIADKPGGLSRTLKGVYEAGADLDFVVARRAPDTPGTGAVFLTPIRGDREVEAASTLGFNLASSVDSVRVEGDNVPGAAVNIADVIANADINIRSFSAAVIGPRYIAYIGFDSSSDADRAAKVLQEAERVAA
ncbi:MAG: amino acid-binding protein [Gammaproteobacteria bacterium]|nr:amino acid-binding protein [Gammaproteobacteria bacterium]